MQIEREKIRLAEEHAYCGKKNSSQMIDLLSRNCDLVIRKSLEKNKFPRANGFHSHKQQTGPDYVSASIKKTKINNIKAKKTEMLRKIAEIRTELLCQPNLAADDKLLLKLCSFIDEYYADIFGFREVIQAIFSLIFGKVGSANMCIANANPTPASQEINKSPSTAPAEISKKDNCDGGVKRVASIKLFHKKSSIEERYLGTNNQIPPKLSLFRVTSMVSSSQSSVMSKGTEGSQTFGMGDQMLSNKLKNLEGFLRSATINQKVPQKSFLNNDWSKTALQKEERSQSNFFLRKDRFENADLQSSTHADKIYQSSKSLLPFLDLKSVNTSESTRFFAANNISPNNLSISEVIGSLASRTHLYRPYKTLYQQLQEEHFDLKNRFQILMKKDLDFYETNYRMRGTSLAETANNLEQTMQLQIDSLRKEKFSLIGETLKTKFELVNLKKSIIEVSKENEMLLSKCEAWHLKEHQWNIQINQVNKKCANAVQSYELVDRNNLYLSNKLAEARAEFEKIQQAILSQIETIKQMDFRPFFLKDLLWDSSQTPALGDLTAKSHPQSPISIKSFLYKNLIESSDLANEQFNVENAKPAKGDSSRFSQWIRVSKAFDKKIEFNSIDPRISIMRRSAQRKKSAIRLRESSNLQTAPFSIKETSEWMENEALFKEAQNGVLEALNQIPQWLSEASKKMIEEL